jgi:hypothetical protein
MPFVEQKYSDILRDELGLPCRCDDSSYSYSYSIYRYDNSDVFFYRQYGRDLREHFLVSSGLRIGTYSLNVIAKRRIFYRGAKGTTKLVSYVAETNVPLAKSLVARARKYLKVAPLESYDRKHRDFKIVIEDKSKPKKSRSTRKLIQYLNLISSEAYKVQLIYCQGLFLSLLNDDEIQKIHNHIYETGGKGLSPLAILFFVVGVSKKQNFDINLLKKYPDSALGPTMAWLNMAGKIINE